MDYFEDEARHRAWHEGCQEDDDRPGPGLIGVVLLLSPIMVFLWACAIWKLSVWVAELVP